jgi:hypothetical protein
MKYTYELDILKRFKYLKPAEEGDNPIIEIEKFGFRNIICGFHGVSNGKIVEIGFTEEEKKVLEAHNKVHRIDDLKELLNKSDFKMMKCFEAQLNGDEYPYDYEALIKERKSWREEINRLEKEVL